MVKNIYWQHKPYKQDKAKKIETGLFPYEENLKVKLKESFKYKCQEFLGREILIGSAKDHKVNIILSVNNTNSIK